MAEIEELKDRIGYIEREKISKIEEDILQIRLGQTETNTLVKEFTKIMDKQNTTQEKMSIAMQEISYTNTRLVEKMNEVELKVDKTNENIKCVEINTAKKFEDVSKEIERQDEEIKKQDEKSKIDLLVILKNNLVAITLGVLSIWLGLQKLGVL